jgi:Ca-activated chloride channel family protein
VIRIEHNEYLVGLAALPLLLATLYFLLSWKKKTAGRIGDPVLVRQLVRSFSSWRFLLKAGLALLAFIAIVLGAGNPQKPGSMENIQRKGVDVVFVLDVSKSMLARDIKPSRLEKAKQLMLQLVDKLENDRVGLILFAGRPYMQMPLTTDLGASKMYIQEASPDAVPTQGTVISEALQMANGAFDVRDTKYKTIILISDGEDHDPDAEKIAKKLAQDGVMINAVGIGTPDGSPIVDPATGELKKDEQGNVVMSKLNEAELQQLATTTNGQYIRLDNVDDALITMTQQLDNAGKKSVTDAELIDYKSFFQWFLAAGLVLLVVEFLLSERRKKIPAVVPSLLVLFLGCAALPVSAQSTNARIRSGNRFYRKNQLDRSIQQYQSAVQQTPNSPTANYNLGNAQYKKNQFDAASKSYDATIQNSADNKMKQNGYYNKGVALIKQKKLQESIDAWKKALKMDASDADARDNLERALRQLKQQQQQQQQNQDEQKKNQKDQKKNEKKNQDQQQQQQEPKPQPSRLNKQEVEQLLKALEQKENDLHNKMQQNKTHIPNQPDKDW